jgi:hypothetical protein
MNRSDIIRTLRLAYIGEHSGRNLVMQSQIDKALDSLQEMEKDDVDVLMGEVWLGVPEHMRPVEGKEDASVTAGELGQAFAALPGCSE